MDNISKLKKDFLDRHSGLTLFERHEILRYFDMAYCLGHDTAKQGSHYGQSKKVVRSDGVRYNSIVAAARLNKIDDSCLRRALRLGTKSAGHTWKHL